MQRVSAIDHSVEAGFNKIFSIIQAVAPVANLVPGLQVPIEIAEGVGSVVQKLESVGSGQPQVDSASLAAGQIAASTGDAALDARLAQIEIWIEQIGPLFVSLANEFGLTSLLPSVQVTSVATQTATQTAAVGNGQSGNN